jgi:hypothetical protein
MLEGQNVARLCVVLPVKHVADYLGTGSNAVKQINREHLDEKLGLVDLSGVEVIATDEFTIQKGHRYATVIVDPTTKRVLWLVVVKVVRMSGRSSRNWAQRAGDDFVPWRST